MSSHRARVLTRLRRGRRRAADRRAGAVRGLHRLAPRSARSTTWSRPRCCARGSPPRSRWSPRSCWWPPSAGIRPGERTLRVDPARRRRRSRSSSCSAPPGSAPRAASGSGPGCPTAGTRSPRTRTSRTRRPARASGRWWRTSATTTGRSRSRRSATHPVVGIGAGGFENRYAENKHYPKHSRYAHDVWLRALSETGVVGLALLLAALLAGLATLVRVRRRARAGGARGDRRRGGARRPRSSCSAASTGWRRCRHCWRRPSCLPLAVMRAAAPARRARLPWGDPAAPPRGRRDRRDGAARTWPCGTSSAATTCARATRASALEAYDRAARLQPAGGRAATEAAASSASTCTTRRSRAASFERALDVREDWVARFELGLLDSQAGRTRRAALAPARARRAL